MGEDWVLQVLLGVLGSSFLMLLLPFWLAFTLSSLLLSLGEIATSFRKEERGVSERILYRMLGTLLPVFLLVLTGP